MKFCENYSDDYAVLKNKNVTLDELWKNVNCNYENKFLKNLRDAREINKLADFYQRSPMNEKKEEGWIRRYSWEQWREKRTIEREEAFLLPLYLKWNYFQTQDWFEEYFNEEYWPMETDGEYDLHEVILHYSVLFKLKIDESFNLYQVCSRKITRLKNENIPFETNFRWGYWGLYNTCRRNDQALIELIELSYGQFHLNEKKEKKLQINENFLMYLETIDEDKLIRDMYESPYNLKKSDNYKKKIEKWKNNNLPIDRQYAFLLCFYLRLSYEDSKKFMTEELHHRWIHAKNLDEVLYAIGLKAGLDIEDIYDLRDEFSNKIEKYENQYLTPDLRAELDKCLDLLNSYNKEEQIKFIRKYLEKDLSRFSNQRNSLYGTFLEIIRQPNSSFGYVREKMVRNRYSKEWLIQNLSSMTMPNEFRSDCNDVGRSWKNALTQYQKRIKEVPREVLLRMFVILGYVNIDDINHKLDKCSLPQLNLSLPLDLIICYYITHLESDKNLCEHISEAIYKYLG